jgi:hypothetical protein
VVAGAGLASDACCRDRRRDDRQRAVRGSRQRSVSWLGASALLLGVSAIANVIPALRAARVEPSQALRME